VDEARLNVRQSQLQATEAQAQAALADVTASRQAAQATIASQEATLSRVTGQIATLVAAQQAQEQAEQYAAFQKRIADAPHPSSPAPDAPARSAPASTATTPGTPGTAAPGTPPPVIAPSGGAGRAVAAAESQIGVPYEWGGEDPGVGFDCSGLTQWAWGQAGVSLPRTAQEQYDAVEHVSLSALEPGDLLFWGGGPGDIGHVGMYVGGGEVIHAPETGEVVHIQPIWNSDLVGAGRP
jgi:cell wall-associated NlpC family hydrolase